ncbi:MAG: DUF4249 domain-containing protein [Bacteroidales bacterium]|nr:DUF4249 domain-containing protein [Bacteroidales bacterium]MDY0199027.1 DUF4249 domain-containing protein [Tenuifilaceae bacterium]
MATRLFITYRLNLSILMFFMLALTSCTERIDIELDSTYTRCVIYGEFTTDTLSHSVSITRTSDYFKNEKASPVSGAIVTIGDGENSYNLTEDLENPGNYYTNSDVYGVVGKVYTLFVDGVDLLDNGNLRSYKASSEIKPVTPPDSIKVIYQRPWNAWLINIYAQDPLESEDFYKFLVYQNGELHSDSLHKIQVIDDVLFNGNYTNGISIYFVDADSENTFNTGDTIMVEFCGLTQDYYNYMIELQSSAGTSIPFFGGPPANPRTNLSNGAIGFFAAYSVAKTSTVIKTDL